MKVKQVVITPPNFEVAKCMIEGTAPYVQIKFSEKVKAEMKAKHMAGGKAQKGKKREARDFEQDYQNALHVSTDGWYGIPAPAFRCAMISACRLVGFQMVKAKISVFIEADGFDETENTPLVKIIGKPHPIESHVRNATGVADIRVRAMWDTWEVKLKVKYDADLFSFDDVANLLMRAGQQVGVGEGRPSSKMSNGMGWGTFRIVNK